MKNYEDTNSKISRRELLRVLSVAGFSLIAGTLLTPIVVTAGSKVKARAFFGLSLPEGLRMALEHAGTGGFVASMPQLLHARASSDYDNLLWNTWFTVNSEESVVTTPQGNHVIVAIHGGGIFTSPERFEKTLRADSDRNNPIGLTGQYAAKITQQEARDIQEGKLPNGTQIPIYSYTEFKKGIADLPMRYGVIIDYERAKASKRGYERFSILKHDPNMIIRAGGPEPLEAYLEKAKSRNNTEKMGNWHPYLRINPDQPQTRILFLAGNKGGIGSEGDDQGLGWGYDADYGIGGDAGMVNISRYVAVSSAHLDFEL